MSSRLLPPGGSQDAEAFAWRQIARGSPGPVKASAAAPEAAAEYERKLRDMQLACEQKVREAHAAGVREGDARGRREAAAEVQPVIERMARAIDELAGLRSRLRREAEADMIRLSMAIARRILHRELAVDPGALHGLVLAALEKLQAQEISRVRTHPDIAPMLKDALRGVAVHRTPDVLADPSCDRGTLVFETVRGNLDVSVNSQLEEIERGLADRLRRNT